MKNTNIDNESLGKMLIISAINMDEALADLLKIETRRLRQLSKGDVPFEEIRKTHSLVRSIIMSLTLTDEKIKTGLSLCNCKDQ